MLQAHAPTTPHTTERPVIISARRPSLTDRGANPAGVRAGPAGPAPPGSERGWPRSRSVCAPLTQNLKSADTGRGCRGRVAR